MFLQWYRDELVLSFTFVQRYRFVGQDAASKAHHCASTNVMHNAARQIRYFEHWHICLPHISARHQSEQNSQDYVDKYIK